MVDMKSPMPSVLNRKKQVPTNRRATFPFKGMENQNMAKAVTMTIWATAMML
jgi:hypothetical protein